MNIPGNHHVKRALEVRAVAGVPLLLIGHPRSDASELVSEGVTWETPCPCGNYGDPAAECTCEEAAIRAHRAGFGLPAMVVEVTRPGLREILSPRGENIATVEARVSAARARFPEIAETLDRECAALLEQAYDTLRLWPRDVRQILIVSRAVAALDGAERIGAAHLLEAIQYKTLSIG